MSLRELERLKRLAFKAMDNGGVVRQLGTVEWDISGHCSEPYGREFYARPDGMHVRKSREARGVPVPARYAEMRWQEKIAGDPGNWRVIIFTPCRKCDRCRGNRKALWRRRALVELLKAERTWFVTVTLSPEQHFIMISRARRRLRRGAVDYDVLGEDEQFRERHSEISRELVLWMKRVRKESGAKLRFVAVCERHDGKRSPDAQQRGENFGAPHYHLLVHERGGTRVTKRTLQGQWPFGFTTCKLVLDDDYITDTETQVGLRKAAWYVAKYTAKEARTRIRASVRYGQDALALSDLGNVKKSLLDFSFLDDETQKGAISSLPTPPTPPPE